MPPGAAGEKVMDPAFTDAVRAAGILLSREERQAAFLAELKKEQEELRELRRELGGNV